MEIRTPAHVQRALDDLGLGIRVREHDAPTATAEEAAAAAGCELGAIVKSLCFTVNGEPVLILTAGDQRVDERKIDELYGVSRKKVRMADRDTTIAVTGYEPGGVPPIGLATTLPVLVDETLRRYEIVHAAAGASNATFPIPFQTLVQITDGRIADIAKG
ncbi:MAG TPA: YbaK/EbsC family protein [Aggregatilineales bacterium]|nr:YbaK/EbsC family protein [Aggregatilineales bacterium]